MYELLGKLGLAIKEMHKIMATTLSFLLHLNSNDVNHTEEVTREVCENDANFVWLDASSAQ